MRRKIRNPSAFGDRKNKKSDARTLISVHAARIMAEDGVDDFALAKRKAARRLGVPETESLPANDEIETELRAYRTLYQAREHAVRIDELRHTALNAMRALARFSPYLTGAVLTGIAGPYAEIELQLFPESEKDLGLFLLDRSILHTTQKARRFAGDRAHAISLVALNWEGHALRLSVFDRRDERLALKTSQAGKVAERARISEVEALLAASGRGSVLK